MPRTVSYEILDAADGRFSVVATMAPGRTHRRDDFDTIAAAEEWIDGLRVLMAACGAPLVQADPTPPPTAPAHAKTGPDGT